jgi:hypothetical protein
MESFLNRPCLQKRLIVVVMYSSFSWGHSNSPRLNAYSSNEYMRIYQAVPAIPVYFTCPLSILLVSVCLTLTSIYLSFFGTRIDPLRTNAVTKHCPGESLGALGNRDHLLGIKLVKKLSVTRTMASTNRNGFGERLLMASYNRSLHS